MKQSVHDGDQDTIHGGKIAARKNRGAVKIL
jgi:hypothetical protein